MNDEVLTNLKSEFKLWGVKPEVNYLNSGHIELTWHASPDKPSRRYIIPKTGSDWRGWLNARSKIRQLFKQDNLSLKQQCAKPKPVLAKALAIPEPIERDIDQIKMLRAEVGDLSELVLGMMSMLKELIAVTPPPVQQPVPMQAAAEVVKKPSVRSLKTIGYVSDSWSSLDAIARDMGLNTTIAYRKLYYELRKGTVEASDGRWRKKPEPAVPPASLPALAKRKTKSNGQHQH